VTGGKGKGRREKRGGEARSVTRGKGKGRRGKRGEEARVVTRRGEGGWDRSRFIFY
jgi:hypothetical protein